MKVKIITPLLEMLGWDRLRPEVAFEYPTRGGDVDYALFKNGSPVVLIEAKARGANLSENQLRDYMYGSSAEYGLLTNGIEYRLLRKNAQDFRGIQRILHAEYDELFETVDQLEHIHFEAFDSV